MNKNIILIFVFLLLLGIASAKEIYQKDETIDLTTSCINQNTNSYCSSSSQCNITLNYPDSSLIVGNAPMDNYVSYFNYTLNSTYTDQLGDYSGNILCVDGSDSQATDFTFLITPSGKENTTAQGLIYLGLIVLMTILFAICLNSAFSIDGSNFQDWGGLIQINFNKYAKYGLFFLSYLLLWIISYFAWLMSQNFLFLDFMAGMLKVIFIILTIMLPIIFTSTAILTLVKWLLDIKLHKLAVRGLKPR